MNTSHLLQKKGSPALWALLSMQETRSIHDSMNIPKIEFIPYIYILLLISKIKKIINVNLGIKTVLYLKYNCINDSVGV